MVTNDAKILIVDDEPGILNLLTDMLSQVGYQISQATSGEQALEMIGQEKFNLLLSDVMMPGMTGFELLKQARQADPDLEVVIMTGFSDVDGAVKSIQEGAANYLTKPFSKQLLEETVKKALENHRFRDPHFAEHLTKEGEKKEWSLVTQDPTMKKLLDMIKTVAPTSATLLIQGETGTGKELMARYLHTYSPRKKEKFIAINCAAIPKDLMENELFGHEKGAFTGATERRIGKFEAADGGTLLLDEVGEMSLETQAKILRILEEKEFYRVGGTDPVFVNTRVIAATNRNLKELVREGKFREDLYYRLNVICIRIPPLRERPEDIPLLIDLFLQQYAGEHQLDNLTIEPAAVHKLKSYPWPGNVRELDNIVLRAALTAPNSLISPEDIMLDEEAAEINLQATSRCQTLEEVEKEVIVRTLREHDGNRTHSARVLGISLRTLRNKIVQYRASGLML